MKWGLLIAVLAFAAAVVGIGYYLAPNNLASCTGPTETGRCRKADAIVVVSGGNTSLRTDTAIGLYKAGWADSLLMSGAAFDENSPSNASAMRAQAVENGVPERAIYVDESARTTSENATNTAQMFTRYGFKRVILVTSAYHQRRAMIEFEKHSPSIEIVNRPVEDTNDWSWWWWLTPRGWWLAGGELVKITVLYVSGGKL